MIDIRKEMEFWTYILRDHAFFQYSSLSPQEKENIKTAEYFMDLFDKLNQEVLYIDEQLQRAITGNLIAANQNATTQFVQFKKKLLLDLLKCKIAFSMPPSFLNHMINEAMEYLRVLCLAENTVEIDKTMEMLRLHTVWLADASGHAKYINAQLDGIEAEYEDEAEDYMEDFDALLKKSNELSLMYDRVVLSDGIITQFNTEVEDEITSFIEFLGDLKQLRTECKISAAGTFSERILNHMISEEQYYMFHIKSLANNQ